MKKSTSLFLNDTEQRAAEFQRDFPLESLLQDLEYALAPVDAELSSGFHTPASPPLFLLGNPRSGTSVLMQLLAQNEGFCVPSNLLARFYYAPYLGAKIQKLLCDGRLDKHGEMADLSTSSDMVSKLGKTRGALAPNEFYHFWRRYIPTYDIEFLDSEQLAAADVDGLLRSIAAIQSELGKPFACKALMLQYNLDFFSRAIPCAFYVYLRRQPDYVMQSILQARESFYRDRSTWWSVKPQEYADLSGADVYHQIAGQVYYTQKAIEEGLSSIPQEYRVTIDYEDLCRSPATVYRDIIEKYNALGFEVSHDYKGPPVLKNENIHKVDEGDFQRLSQCYKELSGD